MSGQIWMICQCQGSQAPFLAACLSHQSCPTRRHRHQPSCVSPCTGTAWSHTSPHPLRQGLPGGRHPSPHSMGEQATYSWETTVQCEVCGLTLFPVFTWSPFSERESCSTWVVLVCHTTAEVSLWHCRACIMQILSVPSGSEHPEGLMIHR